eukprot:m.17589 g.17589  ORF g.17589 m.17589 type:complete len:508 (-) comp11257_c0_seq2:159-1682(-)
MSEGIVGDSGEEGHGAHPDSHQATVLSHLKGHKWNVTGLHFHPTGSMIVSSSWDRTLRIWDVSSGLELKKLDRQMHTAPVTSVRWHPNGALLASTSADNTTAIWDAATGKRIRTLREHFGWVLMCSFAPDRTKFATASWDKTVRLWDPNTGELISTLRGHTKGVWACAFYPVGHTSALLASGGEDCTTRLWDTRSRKVALTLSGGHADAVYDVAWSADGSTIASSSSDNTIVIWDPKAGKILRMLKGHDDIVKRCAFSPVQQSNGIRPLASVGGCVAKIWDPSSGRLHTTIGGVHEAGKEVECLDINTAGTMLATGSRDGTVVLQTMPEVPRVAMAPENRVANHGYRRTDMQADTAEWKDQVRRRKEAMLQKGKSVNETAILSGFDRKNTVVKASAVDEGEHPMLADGRQHRSPAPQKKVVGDATSMMARRRAQTDATAETVREASATRTDPAEPVVQQPGTVTDLMSAPSIAQKVRLRSFNMRRAQDSSTEVSPPDNRRRSVFENM